MARSDDVELHLTGRKKYKLALIIVAWLGPRKSTTICLVGPLGAKGAGHQRHLTLGQSNGLAGVAAHCGAFLWVPTSLTWPNLSRLFLFIPVIVNLYAPLSIFCCQHQRKPRNCFLSLALLAVVVVVVVYFCSRRCNLFQRRPSPPPPGGSQTNKQTNFFPPYDHNCQPLVQK